MKIGIEICDEKNDYMDFSKLEEGNPGIGGIGYQMLLMGYSLYEYYDDYEIVYFHYCGTNKYPEGTQDIICKDYQDVLDKAVSMSVDCLFVNCNKDIHFYRCLRSTNLKVVVRAGCYLEKKEVDMIMKTSQVVRVVAVASEEYDHYIDHDIIDRMICVENSMSFLGINERNSSSIGNHRVAYIGSLVPQKGFHYLAKVWPRILRKFPDAHLDVIGSGKLYDKSSRLGKYGIAESSFEKNFMKYLTDSNGNIIPSVSFLGVIGAGKGNILKDISVGVVNPTALTECCCTSSLDFEAAGIPVVTCGRYGIPSTVINGKTGLTYKLPTEEGLFICLTRLMKNEKLNERIGHNARKFAKDFDRKKMVIKWDEEIRNLVYDRPVRHRKVNGNYYNDLKWLRLINAFLRRNCKMSFLPSVMDWTDIYLDFGHFIMGNLRKLRV